MVYLSYNKHTLWYNNNNKQQQSLFFLNSTFFYRKKLNKQMPPSPPSYKIRSKINQWLHSYFLYWLYFGGDSEQSILAENELLVERRLFGGNVFKNSAQDLSVISIKSVFLT